MRHEHITINEELAKRANQHISFTPEKRGLSLMQDFRDDITNLYNSLYQNADDSEKNKVEDITYKLALVLKAKFEAYLYSKSNCASTMITGGSGFNVRRNEKRMRACDNKLSDYVNLYNKLVTRYSSILAPSKRKIMSGDNDAVTRLEAKIAKNEKHQAMMKDLNKVLRSKKTDAEKISYCFDKYQLSEKTTLELLNPCASYYQKGFQSFELTNLGATIRNDKKRLEQLKQVKTLESKELEFKDGKIEINYSDNRIRIFHNQKPERSILTELKSKGFRWTPTLGCWQAYVTYNANNYIQSLTNS